MRKTDIANHKITWTLLQQNTGNLFEGESFKKNITYQNWLKKKEPLLPPPTLLTYSRDLIMNLLPDEIYNFSFVSKEIEAQGGKRKLLKLLWVESEVCGCQDSPSGGGGWSSVCYWGCSITRHFKCTSRRGIWHLNFPWMFWHIQLMDMHSSPVLPLVLSIPPNWKEEEGQQPEPRPEALWLSSFPSPRTPSNRLGAHRHSPDIGARLPLVGSRW